MASIIESTCILIFIVSFCISKTGGVQMNNSGINPEVSWIKSYGSLRNGPVVVHNVIGFCPENTVNKLRMTAHSQDLVYKNIKRHRFCHIYSALSSLTSDPCHIIQQLDSIKVEIINTNRSQHRFYMKYSKIIGNDNGTGLQALAFNLKSLEWNTGIMSTIESIIISFNETGIKSTVSSSRSLEFDTNDILYLLQHSKYYDVFGNLWVYSDEWENIMRKAWSIYGQVSLAIIFFYFIPWVPFMSACIVGRHGMLYSTSRCLSLLLILFSYPILAYLARKHLYHCILTLLI